MTLTSCELFGQRLLVDIKRIYFTLNVNKNLLGLVSLKLVRYFRTQSKTQA